MPRNAIKTHSDHVAPISSVIFLPSREIEAYSNIKVILNRPSINALDESTVELLKDLMQVTYSYSRLSIPDTSQAIARAVLDWEHAQERTLTGIDLKLFAYDNSVAGPKEESKDSSHRELTSTLLERMLPLSFAIWAAACLVAAAISWTMFAYGLGMGMFVIGPWLNLMLCVASTGLSATVVAAIIDWRRKHSGRQPKR